MEIVGVFPVSQGFTIMADAQSAWGIEIGQAGLKAIKLRYAEAAQQVVAVAFDYVPILNCSANPMPFPTS